MSLKWSLSALTWTSNVSKNILTWTNSKYPPFPALKSNQTFHQPFPPSSFVEAHFWRLDIDFYPHLLISWHHATVETESDWRWILAQRLQLNCLKGTKNLVSRMLQIGLTSRRWDNSHSMVTTVMCKVQQWAHDKTAGELGYVLRIWKFMFRVGVANSLEY